MTIASANRVGVVLYADASHPSARRAVRRSPVSDPQLPSQIAGPGPKATISRPWLSRSMAASVLARGTGPRMTGSDTVVASVMTGWGP